MNYPPAEIGILGGSGLYGLAGLQDCEEVEVKTPFGDPSDRIRIGTIGNRTVAFLARHGRNHTLLPSDINYRANIYAMKLLGVNRILSASAVGSMRESIHPRQVVLPDQFIDRTRNRISTFFGNGVAAHISFADPVCPELRSTMLSMSRAAGVEAHDGGTYVCMEGPAFSTRAESQLYRSWGVDIIGMTNLQEAKLSREAEICYATLALVTDYDCWHEDEEDVSVKGLLATLKANSRLAADVLRQTVLALPQERRECRCGEALKYAMITGQDYISPEARKRLAAILD
ncbi:MAG: S-methyl-5'-thioadenosine phosphorylase [Acidobacteria bacterium]|uniref:S-methyl-5'-thioadenosine phosphorylase n=1 Tax=Candidatus Polarisedimenticola svalbardensis TaxID=2886004 RepID=A0A8J7C179_9BACT|nr:S-methyl-5'-thioadenosine phosphorylase [Candidatus Polarisedimenticola svalbardensis]